MELGVVMTRQDSVSLFLLRVAVVRCARAWGTEVDTSAGQAKRG